MDISSAQSLQLKVEQQRQEQEYLQGLAISGLPGDLRKNIKLGLDQSRAGKMLSWSSVSSLAMKSLLEKAMGYRESLILEKPGSSGTIDGKCPVVGKLKGGEKASG